MPVRAVAPGPNREPNQYYQAISRSVEIDPRAITALMWVPTPVPPPKPPVRPILAPQVVNKVSAVVEDPAIGDGWCTDFVWSKGYSRSKYHGNAVEWKEYINTKNPREGDVVVLREGPIGHVAIIESLASKSISIIEQNFVGKGIVSRRTISRDYARIVGFIMP